MWGLHSEYSADFASFPNFSWWWISIAHVWIVDDRMTPDIHCICKRSLRGTQQTDWFQGENIHVYSGALWLLQSPHSVSVFISMATVKIQFNSLCNNHKSYCVHLLNCAIDMYVYAFQSIKLKFSKWSTMCAMVDGYEEFTVLFIYFIKSV